MPINLPGLRDMVMSLLELPVSAERATSHQAPSLSFPLRFPFRRLLSRKGMPSKSLNQALKKVHQVPFSIRPWEFCF